MKAEIIASGTELLLGEAADTNTSFLAAQLALLGIDLYYTSIVGDNYERFAATLKQAWERADLIITTGGLGPTKGDITREVVARIAGEILFTDDCLKKEISDFFARRGAEMPENNLRQAALIPSAAALHNIAGTAPGWWVEKDGRIIISLPGPPAEMQAMWNGEVRPRLEARSDAIIFSRTLKTWGTSEAKIDQLVTPFLSSPNPTLALYAKQDGIHLRITAKASTRESAGEMLAIRENEIRDMLKETIWGTDNDTLDGVVGAQLIGSRKTLAVVETITGGLFANVISGGTDSNRYFQGGVVLSSPASKEKFAARSQDISSASGVDDALKLAATVRSFFNADIGMAIDGDCGKVSGEQSCMIAVAIDTGTSQKVYQEKYSGLLPQIARRTVNFALVKLKNVLS